uniref:DNA topoisomerase n=1 Tax=Meloidogyne javanica TaxID=6303 RepID=A0A915LGR8_MELJA
MVSTSGQIDCSEVQKPIGPQPLTSSQLNKEVDEGEISDEDAVTLSNLVRAPPPAVSRSVIVQALYLLIEHHNNKEKQTDLDEYTITCRLRSRNSATQGKEGAIVRHKDGPFNQTNHIFIASRLRDLEKLGRAKLVSSNARYEEIKQPAPMNLFTLIRIASERLNFSPKYTMELANRLHKSKLLTNPTTFAKAYPAGFPNEDFIKNIIKQADELCKLRVDTRLILANFVRPKSKELRGFTSNNTTFGGVNPNTSVPIHPCILSTSESLETMLDQCLENDEMELLKLICQYFFATCLQPFTYSVHTFEFEAGPERFMCECQVLATPGFTTYLPWMRPPNVSDQLPEEFRKRNPSREYFVTDIKKVDLPKDVPEHILESEFIELLEKRAVGNSLILDTLNALVELKFVNIVGPGRRITPSATGLELMDQEYRKKMDQLGENATQVESNIGDAQANSASHSSLDSTNTISSVSINNTESNPNLNSKTSATIIPPIQRNFGFRQRPLGSTHSEFSDCSTRMSLRDFPLQKQQFPCRKQFQSELTLEQQNEQQSTPQLLQQLHIGLAEVPEENFNNKDRDSYRQQRANKNSSTSESNSLFHNRTNNEPFIVRDQNGNNFDEDIKQEGACSVENSSPSKSETLQQQHRWSWMATISSLSTKRRSFPPKNQEKNREWLCSARSNKSSVTDDDFGQYTSKRVRFESPKFRRSASMAPSERYKENNNLHNSSTPRRRSPSPERRRSQYRNINFSNRDHNKFSSRFHDRQQNNFCSSSYQKPQIGTKRPPSDDSDSPVKSFKQQLLNQQRQQKNNDYYPQQRQSRYDSHIRDRDFDRGRRGFQNQQQSE